MVCSLLFCSIYIILVGYKITKLSSPYIFLVLSKESFTPVTVIFTRFLRIILCLCCCRLAGSYEALTGGQTGDALVDFTGGVNEAIDIREGGYQSDEQKQQELFVKMEHGHDHKSLISCSIAVCLTITSFHVHCTCSLSDRAYSFTCTQTSLNAVRVVSGTSVSLELDNAYISLFQHRLPYLCLETCEVFRIFRLINKPVHVGVSIGPLLCRSSTHIIMLSIEAAAIITMLELKRGRWYLNFTVLYSHVSQCVL